MQKKKTLYRLVDVLTIVIFIATLVALVVFWNKIPETIPTHYNGAGVPDSYGYKSSLILLVFAELFTLGSMLFAVVIVKMTTKSNTATTSEKVLMDTIYPMLSVLNLILVVMFSYMIYCSAAAAKLGTYFLPITLICTFLPIFYFLGKYMKITGGIQRKEQKDLKLLDETAPLKVYRTKVDWWLGGLLIICLLLPIWITVTEFLEKGSFDIWIIITELFIALLVSPLFFIKYTLYEEHLKVQCGIYGCQRIRYNSITSIKKTMNPLSSAAMSLKHIQIDYSHGGMILISPVDRDEFIEELKKKCNM